MALDDVSRRLDRICQALHEAAVPFALVGGQAVALWVASRDPAAVRTTKDVDVLAGVDASVGLVDPRPLSPTLAKVVDAVGAELDLPPGWLNAGPADQVIAGFPDGFLSRLIRREYGPKLIIHYPDRYDLIHLKLFAAVDQGPGRHVSDLKKLAPTDDEMLAAARWVLTQDCGEGFALIVKDAVTKIGFPHVASQL